MGRTLVYKTEADLNSRMNHCLSGGGHRKQEKPARRGTRAGFQFGKSRGKNFRASNLRLSSMFLAATKLYRCVGYRTETWQSVVQARMSLPLKQQKTERPQTE